MSHKQQINSSDGIHKYTILYAKMGNKDGKFIYKRIGCNETHYADGYYNMKHKSLFSNHKQK